MNLYRILFAHCGSSEKQTISEFGYDNLSAVQKIEINDSGYFIRNVYRNTPDHLALDYYEPLDYLCLL